MANRKANQAIGQLIGRRLRELRDERRLTREQVAEKVRRVGIAWTPDVVMGFENGRRRDITLGELLGVTYALDMPGGIVGWFDGADTIQLSDDAWADRDAVRALLAGAGRPGELITWLEGRDEEGFPNALVWSVSALPAISPTSAELHAASRLGIPSNEVIDRATRRWGRRLDEERDSRVGAVADVNELRARRGRATRELLSELAGAFDRSVAVLEGLSAPSVEAQDASLDPDAELT